jgi:hypothetical protein
MMYKSLIFIQQFVSLFGWDVSNFLNSSINRNHSRMSNVIVLVNATELVKRMTSREQCLGKEHIHCYCLSCAFKLVLIVLSMSRIQETWHATQNQHNQNWIATILTRYVVRKRFLQFMNEYTFLRLPASYHSSFLHFHIDGNATP